MRYRHRMEYQELSGERNPTGELKQEFTTRFHLWANIEPLTGTEEVFPYTKAKVTHKITTHWRCDVKPNGQLVMGERVFKVSAALNEKEGNRTLLIMATEYGKTT